MESPRVSSLIISLTPIRTTQFAKFTPIQIPTCNKVTPIRSSYIDILSNDIGTCIWT